VHELSFQLASNKYSGGIKPDEEVTFELVFTSAGDPAVNVQGTYKGMAYDSG